MAILLAPLPVLATGPYGVTSTGKPLHWPQPGFSWNLDQGTLGSRSASEIATLIPGCFAIWTSLPDVTLTVTRSTDLSIDVTKDNFSKVYGVRDRLNPIVLDGDGAIIDSLLGEGAKGVVDGFSGPESAADLTGVIDEGIVVLNGAKLSTATPTRLRNVLTHEFGHLLGLTHSDFNEQLYRNRDPDDDALLPIMFPIIRNYDNLTLEPSLTLDDRMGMGWLYPASTYASSGASIRGKVTRGGKPFDGANVIVVDDASPTVNVVSWPSGIAGRGTGAWEAHQLPAGTYTVRLAPINALFNQGYSAVGPFVNPPQDIPREAYNGANESGDPFSDDARGATHIALSPGMNVTGIDMVVNETQIPVNAGQPVSGQLFTVSGALPAAQLKMQTDLLVNRFTVTLSPQGSGPMMLLVRLGMPVAPGATPGTYTADYQKSGTGTLTLTLDRAASPPLTAGTYYIALVNQSGTPAGFSLSTDFRSQQLSDPAQSQIQLASGGGCTARRTPGGGGGLSTAALLMLAVLLVRRSRCDLGR